MVNWQALGDSNDVRWVRSELRRKRSSVCNILNAIEVFLLQNLWKVRQTRNLAGFELCVNRHFLDIPGTVRHHRTVHCALCTMLPCHQYCMQYNCS